MSFAENFTESFVLESTETLTNLSNLIINLTNLTRDTNEYEEILKESLRMLHNVKGAARMLDFTKIERLCHSLEEILKNVDSKKTELSENICALIIKADEEMIKCLSNINSTGTESITEERLELFTKTCKKAATNQYFSLEVFENKDELILEENDSDEYLLNSSTAIRTDIKSLNEIIRSFDNIIITQLRLKHELFELDRIILEEQTKSLKSLPKQIKDNLALAEKEILNTQHKLLSLRMLPLNIILNPIKTELEAEAIKLKKKVRLEIPSSGIMLDKMILEQLKNIILQIMRNSIVHGIEPKKERIKCGKPEEGLIKIEINQIANRITITLSDDGKGLDYEEIRQKAIELNPSREEELKYATESELQQYIFLSGFTTQKDCDTLSGRGIGLDIVKNSVEKIKGKIHLKSKAGQGTVFELNIPLSIGTQQGLFISSGGRQFIIPSHYIMEVFDKDEISIISIQGQNYVSGYEQLVPMYYLSSVLNPKFSSQIKSIIVVEYFDSKLAVAVEEIRQYENVVVNPLPKILRGMESVQGLVYDENYEIIPILNVPYILQKLKNQHSYDLKKYEAYNKKKNLTVLIVDDSETTIQIERSIFESEGYKVCTAKDGIDAMEILKTVHIDAVISDINMPRMDGNILLNNIRLTPEYKNIPVIIVTGVYDMSEKRNFLEKGAQGFFTKSKFDRDELLKAVKESLYE